MDLVKCEKCNEEFELTEENSKWYDDYENENGEHKFDVLITCPHCKNEFWEEIWEDF